MPAAIVNLFQSRKFAFSLALLACAGVLVGLKRIEWAQFLDLAKFLGVGFSIGTGLEAKAGNSPTTGTP